MDPAYNEADHQFSLFRRHHHLPGHGAVPNKQTPLFSFGCVNAGKENPADLGCKSRDF
jgi:hypothetical protein